MAEHFPSLRTGLADLPHTALQSVVLPPRGLTGSSMGCNQGEQPALRKVGIRPALMIGPAPRSLSATPASQDATQAHPHPAVQRAKRGLRAVLEVPKPTHQSSVQTDDSGFQTPPRPEAGLDLTGTLQNSDVLTSPLFPGFSLPVRSLVE